MGRAGRLNFPSTGADAGRLTGRMAENLTVHLGERSYDLQFGVDLTSAVQAHVARLVGDGRRGAVLTDRNVTRDQGKALAAMFGATPVLAVEPGEGAKSLAGFGRAMDFLAEQKLDRS